MSSVPWSGPCAPANTNTNMKLSVKTLNRLQKIGAKGLARAADPEYYKELVGYLSKIQRDMLNAHVKSLGMENANRRYSDEDKIDLVTHVYDYLLKGQFPDFEEISEHMKRTPSALDKQVQKLFTASGFTVAEGVSYGLTVREAKRLIAPQHAVRKNASGVTFSAPV